MSEQGVTLDAQDTKDLIHLHQEAEAYWDQVWGIARVRGDLAGKSLAAHWLAQHRWARYVLEEATYE